MPGCSSCHGPVAMGDALYAGSLQSQFQPVSIRQNATELTPQEQAIDTAKGVVYASVVGLGMYMAGFRPRTIIGIGIGAYVLQAYLAYRSTQNANGV